MHPLLSLFPPMLAIHTWLQPPSPGPEATDRALIWGGFEQDWTYNHRLNRLGDFVGSLGCAGSDCTGSLTHAAASGKGSDTAHYRSFASAVTAPGVGFVQGVTTFLASERRGEGAAMRFHRTATVAARGLLADRGQLHVVLGGFDLRSTADADKLSELSMAVGNARYDAAKGAVSFDVDLDLRLDCDSLECRFFNRGVHYEVDVVWTLMAYDDELAVRGTPAEVAYTWERASRAEELAREDFVSRTVLVGTPNTYEAAFVAFQALSVHLDDDHYMQDWTTALRPGAYSRETGAMDLDLALLFKPWNQLSHSRLWSLTDKGKANISAELALIQLRRGRVTPMNVEGEIAWRADGRPADLSRSQTVHAVEL